MMNPQWTSIQPPISSDKQLLDLKQNRKQSAGSSLLNFSNLGTALSSNFPNSATSFNTSSIGANLSTGFGNSNISTSAIGTSLNNFANSRTPSYGSAVGDRSVLGERTTSVIGDRSSVTNNYGYSRQQSLPAALHSTNNSSFDLKSRFSGGLETRTSPTNSVFRPIQPAEITKPAGRPIRGSNNMDFNHAAFQTSTYNNTNSLFGTSNNSMTNNFGSIGSASTKSNTFGNYSTTSSFGSAANSNVFGSDNLFGSRNGTSSNAFNDNMFGRSTSFADNGIRPNSNSFPEMSRNSIGDNTFGGHFGNFGSPVDSPTFEENPNDVFSSMGTFDNLRPSQQQQQQHMQVNQHESDIFSQAGASAFNSMGSFNQQNNPNNTGMRETGIIEKLLHSYGFIQCCERQARLFFHFSQFDGCIDHLKIGDPVEFEMTYDKRTGKPIASSVSKIKSEGVAQQVLGEERVLGMVTTPILNEGKPNQILGRISYENRGECFFLPFSGTDIEGNVTLQAQDRVSFQIAASPRTGNLHAQHVRLENPAQPVRYTGVVCSMKENFGFIERGDVVREIFFHFSESEEPLILGDHVEFGIQTRGGKELATDILKLAPGSVIFEDRSDEIIKGQVLKTLDMIRYQGDPLSGKIRFRGHDRSEVEVSFGEKDLKGGFTLRHGDWVQFNTAIDRRDKLQRAINITLLEESFAVSGERREEGVIVNLKDGFGFLRCVEREGHMFFHSKEMLDCDETPEVNMEVEFTVMQDPTDQNRLLATRIKRCGPGTVQFEAVLHSDVEGEVISEPSSSYAQRSPSKTALEEKMTELGMIAYSINGEEGLIQYCNDDCDLRNSPKMLDKVLFNINQVKYNKQLKAVAIRIKHRAEPMKNGLVKPLSGTLRGFVAALKDGFGFIESEAHDKEIFYHFSNCECDPNKMELGQEVEYMLTSAGKEGDKEKVAATNVKLLPKGTLPGIEINPEIHDGIVVRPLRSFNPDQSEYAGLVQSGSDGSGHQYQFGITSLVNKREMLQKGDPVGFQVDVTGKWAANITSKRQKLRATVESIKGQFGFLSHELEEGRKLFFHMTEVKDGVTLQQGDNVEFVIITNQRTGKSSACNVTKISNQQRPEHLISKLKNLVMTDSDGRKLVVVRQPRGPDGTKGFRPRGASA